MDKKKEERPCAPVVQVFELTMDNPEDQDELNRRLRKPGEPPWVQKESSAPTDDTSSSARRS